jgi:hypothetical protein
MRSIEATAICKARRRSHLQVLHRAGHIREEEDDQERRDCWLSLIQNAGYLSLDRCFSVVKVYFPCTGLNDQLSPEA